MRSARALLLPALAPLLAAAPALGATPRASLPQEDMLQALGTVREDAHPLVTVALGDLATWASHPKDAGFVRALGMLEGRLADLPMELGDDMPGELRMLLDPQVMPVWMHLLQAPKSVTMGVSNSKHDETGNAMVLGFALHEADAAAAQGYHDRLMGLMQGMGVELPPGLVQVEGNTLQVKAGAAAPAMGTSRAAALAGNGTLVEEVRMNVGAFTGYLREMAESGFAPDEAMIMLGVMDAMGLSDLEVDVAVVSDGAAMRSVSVAKGLGARMRASGILPEGGLTAAHLAPVPADATLAMVERVDMRAAFEALNGLVNTIMAQQGMGEQMDLGDVVKSSTGIDLREDLFGAMGKTVGLYASDTTGGGGVTSMVMFAEVVDADALVDSRETITDLINALAMGPARGYVSFRTWEADGVEYTTLMFPGLPVPFEPTLALSESWMVMGSTPTAARGAMGHIARGGPSLATVPAVAAALAAGERTAVSYFDTAHYARIGYGPTSLLMSAVGNAVRSPIDATREPGPVMPTYAAFREGILPAVGYTEVRGADLVSVSTGDGSFVVGVASVFGLVQEYAALFALPLAALGAEELGREFGFRF